MAGRSSRTKPLNNISDDDDGPTSNVPRSAFLQPATIQWLRGVIWLPFVWLVRWRSFDALIHSTRCDGAMFGHRNARLYHTAFRQSSVRTNERRAQKKLIAINGGNLRC